MPDLYGWLLCLFMLVLGCCVGSFLNVLALRSLKEESIIWPSSYCPECKHPLSALDNIPIISFLMLSGKCRYCAKPISIQYPIVEITTGVTFAALAFVFLVQPVYVLGFWSDPRLAMGPSETHDLFQGIRWAMNPRVTRQELSSCMLLPNLLPNIPYTWGLFAGLLALSATLIAVTVTDLREKLIPHEITYPSMIIGIAFSALVRGDLMGAMAGIGASYIIFDFLAFYGQKFYLATRAKNDAADEKQSESADQEKESPEAGSNNQDGKASGEEEPAGEELPEVMGGGDAVLSAVMAAYLGWQSLVLALGIGFLAGTAMGLVLLCGEMKKAGLLKTCGLQSLKWGLICGLIFSLVMGSIPLILWILGLATETDVCRAVISAAISCFLVGGGCGALIGMVKVGTQVSKPFPFGPALALGGFIAMFLIPHWLPLYN